MTLSKQFINQLKYKEAKEEIKMFRWIVAIFIVYIILMIFYLIFNFTFFRLVLILIGIILNSFLMRYNYKKYKKAKQTLKEIVVDSL